MTSKVFDDRSLCPTVLTALCPISPGPQQPNPASAPTGVSTVAAAPGRVRQAEAYRRPRRSRGAFAGAEAAAQQPRETAASTGQTLLGAVGGPALPPTARRRRPLPLHCRPARARSRSPSPPSEPPVAASSVRCDAWAAQVTSQVRPGYGRRAAVGWAKKDVAVSMAAGAVGGTGGPRCTASAKAEAGVGGQACAAGGGPPRCLQRRQAGHSHESRAGWGRIGLTGPGVIGPACGHGVVAPLGAAGSALPVPASTAQHSTCRLHLSLHPSISEPPSVSPSGVDGLEGAGGGV